VGNVLAELTRNARALDREDANPAEPNEPRYILKPEARSFRIVLHRRQPG